MKNELVELKLDQMKILFKILKLKNPKCDYCKKSLLKGTGLFHADVMACTSPLCIIEALDRIEVMEMKKLRK